MEEETKKESFKISGEGIMEKVKKVIKEGNVRKITISDKEGKTVAEFPLTVGVVGALLAPVVAAIGAIVALVAECTITIEKR